MVGDGVTTREARKRKRNSSVDSAGTDSAREGRSPPDKCTNTVSPATPPAKCTKDKQTKQATIALVVATPSSTVPTCARLTRSSTLLAASSQAPLTPDTTSEALLAQEDLARSDEPCALQHPEGS